AGIADAVAVGVLLAGVRNARTVVARVADRIAVEVGLRGVRDQRAVVARVADEVAVGVVVDRERVDVVRGRKTERGRGDEGSWATCPGASGQEVARRVAAGAERRRARREREDAAGGRVECVDLVAGRCAAARRAGYE